MRQVNWDKSQSATKKLFWSFELVWLTCFNWSQCLKALLPVGRSDFFFEFPSYGQVTLSLWRHYDVVRDFRLRNLEGCEGHWVFLLTCGSSRTLDRKLFNLHFLHCQWSHVAEKLKNLIDPHLSAFIRARGGGWPEGFQQKVHIWRLSNWANQDRPKNPNKTLQKGQKVSLRVYDTLHKAFKADLEPWMRRSGPTHIIPTLLYDRPLPPQILANRYPSLCSWRMICKREVQGESVGESRPETWVMKCTINYLHQHRCVQVSKLRWGWVVSLDQTSRFAQFLSSRAC